MTSHARRTGQIGGSHALGGLPGMGWLWGGAVMGSTLAIVALATPAYGALINDWSFDPASGNLTVTLIGSGNPSYFLLAEPARIVLNIPNARLGNVPLARQYPGAIRSIRAAQFDGNDARIVIELAPDALLDPRHAELTSMEVPGGQQWVLRPLVTNIVPPVPPPRVETLPTIPAPGESPPPSATPVPTVPDRVIPPSDDAPPSGDTFVDPNPAPPVLPGRNGVRTDADALRAPTTPPASAALPVEPLGPPPQPTVRVPPLDLPEVDSSPTPLPEVDSTAAAPPAPRVSVPPLTPEPAVPAPTQPPVPATPATVAPEPEPPVARTPEPAPDPPVVRTPEPAPAAPATPSEADAVRTPPPFLTTPEPSASEPASPAQPSLSGAEVIRVPTPPPATTTPPAVAVPITPAPEPTPPTTIAADPPRETPVPAAPATISAQPSPVPPSESSPIRVIPPPPAAATAPEGPIPFGTPLPGSATAAPEAPPRAIAVAPETSGGLPVGTRMQLQYPGIEPLVLDQSDPRYEVLLVAADVRHPTTGAVLVPQGTQVIGRFEGGAGRSQRFVSQVIVQGSDRRPLFATSDAIPGTPQGGTPILAGAGVGAVAVTVLSGLSGVGLLGGAAIGAATGYLTSPQVVTIEPGQFIEVEVVSSGNP